jgi:two-component system, OmpR family, response regulator
VQHHPHILLAYDASESLDMLAEYLSEQGFAVYTAANTAAIRQSMAEHTVHVVLLDMCMPGEDGFSLVRCLREQAC